MLYFWAGILCLQQVEAAIDRFTIAQTCKAIKMCQMREVAKTYCEEIQVDI